MGVRNGLSLCLILVIAAIGEARVGVDIGLFPDALSYDSQLQRLRNRGVSLIKTYNIDSGFLDAVDRVYAKAAVEITVAIPNDRLSAAAYDPGYQGLIVQALRRRTVRSIAVSNEPFNGAATRAQTRPYLIPAYNKVRQLVSSNGLSTKVIVPLSGQSVPTAPGRCPHSCVI